MSEREAIHQFWKLDPAVVDPAHDFAQALLGGHGNPIFSATFDAKLLHDGLQIEHLLGVARDKLPNLVDHEHQRVARFAPFHEFDNPVRQFAGGDVDFPPTLRP
jgi:hypothetical protein